MADEKLNVLDAIISIYGDKEIGPAADRIPAALKQNLPDDPNSQEFINDFSIEGERFNKAVIKSTINPETKNRHSADKARDKSYLFFRNRTESYIHSDNEEKAQAAALLIDKINLHGYSLHLEGLDKQTVLMDGLILDLQLPEMQKAIELLGVKEEFDSMVKSIADYKQIDDARTQAAVKTELIPLIEARKGVCLIISECNDWLRRRFRKDPQAMESMVRHWNEIISELNAQAQSLMTRKANDAAAKEEMEEKETEAAMG